MVTFNLPSFDDDALRVLADLICGNGPDFGWYKKGVELPLYFRKAGLQCQDFDSESGISRRDWVVDRLREYESDSLDYFKAISRIADPKEHRGHPDYAQVALTHLNTMLEPDGIKLVYQSGSFVIESSDFQFYPDTTPPLHVYTPLSTGGLIVDADFGLIVQSRFDEAAKARSASAHLSTVIMLGSGLEGLLKGFADSRTSKAKASTKAPKERNGSTKPLEDWNLFNLIDVAHDVGWIQKDAHAFGQNVRDFRNLVHPHKQWRGNYGSIDEGTCRVCWEVVSVVVDDLNAEVVREQGGAAGSSSVT